MPICLTFILKSQGWPDILLDFKAYQISEFEIEKCLENFQFILCMIFTPSQKQASTVSKSSSQDSLSQTRSVSCFVLSPLLSLFVFCVHMALPFFYYHYCFLCGLLYYVSGWCKYTKVHVEKILSGTFFYKRTRWINGWKLQAPSELLLPSVKISTQNGLIGLAV